MLLNESGSGASSDVFTLVDGDSLAAGGGTTTARGSSMPPPAPEITSGLAQHRRTLEEQFKTRVAKDSIALILEPGVKVSEAEERLLARRGSGSKRGSLEVALSLSYSGVA